MPSPSQPDEALDRMAVEQIVGEPLPRDWPVHALPPGTRVRVIQDQAWRGPWAQVFVGTINDMAAPEPVKSLKARPYELSYWVTFDEPQRDADGDGPYRKAQIWDRHLEPV